MTPLFSSKDSDTSATEWLLPEETREQLGKYLEQMRQAVHFEVFTREGDNDPFNEYAVGLCRDLARLTDNITLDVFPLDSPEAEKRGATASPTILFNPDTHDIRFMGAPLGEEGKAFMNSVFLLSLNQSGLSQVSKQLLVELNEKRLAQVFVSPTCPYCPGQFMNAVRCAIERPEYVGAHCIETSENRELAEKHNVGSVPHTVINGTHDILGLVPEERFVVELATMRPAEEVAHEIGFGGEHHHDVPQIVEVDLVVIGAGPAGLTAGIYAERAGLKTVIVEKGLIGGQVALTPNVENYPGFSAVAGKTLVDMVTQHAREYVTINEGESVGEIKIGRNVEVYTNRNVYVARALILATGATYRSLGVPGEKEHYGAGVNYCASCDGYLYKQKRVAVVGGGNTALTDALHLKSLGVETTLIHRRDAFRAQQHLQDSVEREGIPVIWNTVVEEVLGEEGRVTGLKLRNTMDDAVTEFACDGAFVAIGQMANNELAKMVGLKLDELGFIKVDRHMRTNIPRIYAAGDITGGLQQIVTAIGEGASAAMAAFEDLAHPYWK